MAKTITAETAIGEILECCPQAAEILLAYGVHCVGCHVSPFEPLGDGFRGHGLGDTEINEAVTKINTQIQKNQGISVVSDSTNFGVAVAADSELTLTLSAKAAAKLKELCAANNKYALRIKVLPGGCSGFKYGMDLVDAKSETDLEIENQGVKIVINQESLEKIAGAEVDYQDTLQGAGFKINNPNAQKTCGCGESFR